MDPHALQSRITGRVTAAGDSTYESLRRQLIWNEFKPARFPKLIIEVANEQDVVEAVRFARANGMKVAVRGGGRQWVTKQRQINRATFA
jgi:FAD/FMN-containing dehydrogenase